MCAVLMLLSGFACGPPVDVFVSGREAASVRIPALVAAGDGSLLAVAEARDRAADHAGNDLVARRSEDGGRTWGPLQTVLAEDGDLALNNPLLVVLTEETPHPGRILLMAQRSAKAERGVRPGYGRPENATTLLIQSDDHGRTCSTPRDVSRQVKRPQATTSAGGPGVGIVVRGGPHRGRVLMPFNQGPFNDWRTYVAISDDGGETWSMGDLAPEPAEGLGGSHANEVQVAERPDGTILMNARSQPGGTRRLQSVSRDGGQTWSPLAFHETLVGPTCQGSLLRLGDGRLLFCNPASASKRENGTLRVSDDGGDTWSGGTVIVPGGFAYSCMAALPGGRVGVLYERDGYQAVSFVAIDVP